MEILRIEALLPAFALVLARVSGLVMTVPMLTSQQIPRATKVWLIVTISLVAFPVVFHVLPESLTLREAALGMVGEFVVGEVLGLGAGFVFLAAQVGGKLISHQSGMALSASFNPVTNVSSAVLDQIWFFAVLMLFLAMRGHLAVVQALLDSFEQVPPLMMLVDGMLAEFVIGVLHGAFEMALRMSGPVVLALLLTSLIMGFLTKTMPQLNILSVGFSFKIATGLFILAITIPFSAGMVTDGVIEGLDRLGLLFESLSEAVTRGG